MAKTPICSIENCGKSAVNIRGWCSGHYYRWRKHGDPTAGRTKFGDPAKFLHGVVFQHSGNDCLIWPYGRTTGGYAQIRVGKSKQYVHRMVCERTRGPAPSAQHEAAHDCGRGSEGCVNQEHVFWKLHTENEADKVTHGTHNRGERHNMAKLTETDVAKIKQMPGMQKDIGLLFGLTQSAVSNIKRGKRWKSLT